MKKILIASVLFIFLISVVIAIETPNASERSRAEKTMGSDEKTSPERIQVAESKTNETDRIPKVIASKPELKGIENAILRVKNNETRVHLEQVFAKIQDKRKEQLAKLENLNFTKDEKTNKTIIKGKGKAKFLGFIPVDKNYEYEVDENTGNVEKRKKAFDFLFKKEDPIDTP